MYFVGVAQNMGMLYVQHVHVRQPTYVCARKISTHQRWWEEIEWTITVVVVKHRGPPNQRETVAWCFAGISGGNCMYFLNGIRRVGNSLDYCTLPDDNMTTTNSSTTRITQCARGDAAIDACMLWAQPDIS